MGDRMACSKYQGNFLFEGKMRVLHLHPQLLLQEFFVILKHGVSLPVCKQGIAQIREMVLEAFFEAQRLYERSGMRCWLDAVVDYVRRTLGQHADGANGAEENDWAVKYFTKDGISRIERHHHINLCPLFHHPPQLLRLKHIECQVFHVLVEELVEWKPVQWVHWVASPLGQQFLGRVGEKSVQS